MKDDSVFILVDEGRQRETVTVLTLYMSARLYKGRYVFLV